ncbi:hypothetical protein Dimus_003944 [Dionaea muscipula]
MFDHGLSNVMDVIKRQKWESLFKGRELVHTDAVKEFYEKLTMSHNRKKDVAKSKDVWEESKYTKPLEITRRFANDETLTAARRIKYGEMKPFQRFIHFLVIKNIVPRFGKRDTSSFMDLTYMDHLMARRLVNFPRVMMRHMSYVISMKDHELPYGDWLTMVFEEFGVPLVDKKGEAPKRYDYFEETFLTMCKLKRENEVWWVGTGENRRRDDEIDAQEEEAEEEEEDQTEFDWEAVIDEAAVEGESGSGEKFYDVEDGVQGSPEVDDEIPAMVTQASAQQKETAPSGVDSSGPSGHIPEVVMNKLQAEFERARSNRFQADLEKAQAENARLLAMLQQAQFKPKPYNFHCQTLTRIIFVLSQFEIHSDFVFPFALNISIAHFHIHYHIMIDAS